MPLKRIQIFLSAVTGWGGDALGAERFLRTVGHRAEVLGCAGLWPYYARLVNDVPERQMLIEELAVTETWFLRNPGLFHWAGGWLAERVMKLSGGERLRVLSAPCATGEEPYSLVALAQEAGICPDRLEVIGVDISARALERARLARYGTNAFRAAPPSFKQRYFKADAGQWLLSPNIRDQVRFVEGNLVEPQIWRSLGKFDLILCRNLLIYLDATRGEVVLDGVRGALRPGGVLALAPGDVPVGGLGALTPLRVPGCALYSRGSEDAQAHQVKADAPPQPRPRRGAQRPSRSVPEPSSPGKPEPSRPIPPVAASPAPHGRPIPPVAASPAPHGRPIPPTPATVTPAAVGQTFATQRQVASGPSVASLEQVLQQANSGALDAALAAWEAHMAHAEPKAQGYFVGGVLHDALGNAERALELLRRALYLDPHHEDALLYLVAVADAREGAGQVEGLKRRLKRLQERRGSS